MAQASATSKLWRTGETVAEQQHVVPDDFKKDLAEVDSVLACAVSAWLKKRGKVREASAWPSMQAAEAALSSDMLPCPTQAGAATQAIRATEEAAG
jgi:hypothetical protein